MGKQIVKQPDGRFAIWSSVVDDFVVVDCDGAEDIIEVFLDEQRCRLADDVTRILGQLNLGKKPYHQFTKSFNDCIEVIKEQHGDDAESLKHFGLQGGTQNE